MSRTRRGCRNVRRPKGRSRVGVRRPVGSGVTGPVSGLYVRVTVRRSPSGPVSWLSSSPPSLDVISSVLCLWSILICRTVTPLTDRPPRVDPTGRTLLGPATDERGLESGRTPDRRRPRRVPRTPDHEYLILLLFCLPSHGPSNPCTEEGVRHRVHDGSRQSVVGEVSSNSPKEVTTGGETRPLEVQGPGVTVDVPQPPLHTPQPPQKNDRDRAPFVTELFHPATSSNLRFQSMCTQKSGRPIHRGLFS